ncbi:MAG: alpha/beta hydrolase [Pirellulales bacterium]|nr:alpha/beta hydrolase [Pirellulales bacterium]
MQTTMVSIGDTSLAVQICGSGPPLVLLHAFPLDHTMWHRVLSLANHARLIIPDQRGFGSSTNGNPEKPPIASIAQLADDVAKLLDALDIGEPAAIAGISMGGYVAQHVAVRYPEKVSRLILIDTKFSADTSEARANRADLAATVGRVGQHVLADAMVPNLLAATDAARSKPERAANEEFLRTLISEQSVVTIQAALQALADRPDMSEPMQHLKKPVLLICGSEDTITPPAVMESMEKILSEGHLLIVPEAGHLVPLEAPVVFHEAVRSFLDSSAGQTESS